MRRVRAAAAAIGLASTTLLAGCTPADEPRVGLTVRDGRPVVVVVACPGVGFAEAGVSRDDAPSDPSTTWSSTEPTRYGTWRVTTRSPQAVTEIPLFQRPPKGWRVEDAELTTLVPGSRYTIEGGGNVLDVHFTPEELARLGPGDVLVETRHGERGTTTRRGFETWAAKDC